MMMSAAVREAGKAVDMFPQQRTGINGELIDALMKNLVQSLPPGINVPNLWVRVEQQLEKILPTFKTPDHPPYALMIRQAILELDDKEASNEEAISSFIKLKYNDLPWAHASFLRHHLKKLRDEGEIIRVSGNCYKLSPEVNDSVVTVGKRQTRQRRHGQKRGVDRQCKISKRNGSLDERKFVADENHEQEGAVNQVEEAEEQDSFQEQQNQSDEQQKQEVTCVLRQTRILGFELDEEVDQEKSERSEDANRTEALHLSKDDHEQNQHLSEDDHEQKQFHDEHNQMGEQQKSEGVCAPSGVAVFGLEVNEEVNQATEEKYERMEGENQIEAFDQLRNVEEKDQLQEQENQLGEPPIPEVACVPSQITMSGTNVNEEGNQVHGQESEISEEVNQTEEESSQAIVAESEKGKQDKAIEEREQGNCVQYEMIEEQRQRLDELADKVVEEQNGWQGKLLVSKDQSQMQTTAGVYEEQNEEGNGGKIVRIEEQFDQSLQDGLINIEQVKAIEQQKQQDDPHDVISGHHLRLQEIGKEIEGIEKLIKPERQLKEMERNDETGPQEQLVLEKINDISKMNGLLLSKQGKPHSAAVGRISSHACPSLRDAALPQPEKEQCLELLERTRKIQEQLMEILKSFGREFSTGRHDLTMLPSKENRLSDGLLSNTSCPGEIDVPTALDMVVVEPRGHMELSNTSNNPQLEKLMMGNAFQNQEKQPNLSEQQDVVMLSNDFSFPANVQQPAQDMVVVQSRQQIELYNTTRVQQPEDTMADPLYLNQEKHAKVPEGLDVDILSSGDSMGNDMEQVAQEQESKFYNVNGSAELQPTPEVNSALEATTMSSFMNKNSFVNMPPAIPDQAVKDKEEKFPEKFCQQNQSDFEPKDISNPLYQEKRSLEPTTSAEFILLSSQKSSEGEQLKPTVQGEEKSFQIKRQKLEVSVQDLELDGPESETWHQQNVEMKQLDREVRFQKEQFESQPHAKLIPDEEVLPRKHPSQTKEQQERCQVKPPGSELLLKEATSAVSSTPQKHQLQKLGKRKRQLSELQEMSPSMEEQQKQVTSSGKKHFECGAHCTSSLDAEMLFEQPQVPQLFQPSSMKPSLLSGEMLQPLRPSELKKLLQPEKPLLSVSKSGNVREPVINVNELEAGNPPKGCRKKLHPRTISPPVFPPSSDKILTASLPLQQDHSTAAMAQPVCVQNEVKTPRRRGRPPKPKPDNNKVIRLPPDQQGYTLPSKSPATRRGRIPKVQASLPRTLGATQPRPKQAF